MKRLLTLLILAALALTACANPNPPLGNETTETPTDTKTTTPADDETTLPDDTETTVPDDANKAEPKIAIRYSIYTWDSWGIFTKEIAECTATDALIAALETATETGETEEKYSDATFEAGVCDVDFPFTPGTKWLETETAIYRISPDFTQICRVETHYGAGRFLTVSAELKEMLGNIWYYHPYDFYVGTYDHNTNTVTLSHAYESESTVSVQIKEISVTRDHHPKNKILLELTSTIDQTLDIKLRSQASEDNLADGDKKNVTLAAGVPQTLEMSFGGFYYSYWIYIFADNTRIELKIQF